MSFTTNEIDLICDVSILVKSTPDTYIDGLFVAYYCKGYEIQLDFVKKEIQLIDFDYQKEIYLQFLGLGVLYELKVVDMYKVK
jgi:hypothetical protein